MPSSLAIPKTRGEGSAPLLFRAPTQPVSDGPIIQRSRSLGFADTESRCIIVRVARLGMARRRVKEIISCKRARSGYNNSEKLSGGNRRVMTEQTKPGTLYVVATPIGNLE